MKGNFEKCLEMLLVHEGGFTADKRDSGNDGDGHGNQGSTNLGVTAKVWAEWTGNPAPIDVMKALTPDDVGDLYKEKYWDRCKCDDLASGLDWCVFDMAVNSGTGRAAKFVQSICGANPDGAIGPKTLALISKIDTHFAIEQFAEKRQEFYESLSAFKHYGNGWTRRNHETKEQSISMAQ